MSSEPAKPKERLDMPAIKEEVDAIFAILDEDETEAVIEETTLKTKLDTLIRDKQSKLDALELPFILTWLPLKNDPEGRPAVILMSNRPATDQIVEREEEVEVEVKVKDEVKTIKRKRFKKVKTFGDFQWQKRVVRTANYQATGQRVSSLCVYQPGAFRVLDSSKVKKDTGLPVKTVVPFQYVLHSPGDACAEISHIQDSTRTPTGADIDLARSATDLAMWEKLLNLVEPVIPENTFLRENRINNIESGQQLGKEIAARAAWTSEITGKKERESLRARLSEAVWKNLKWVFYTILLVGIIYLGYLILLRYLPALPTGGTEIGGTIVEGIWRLLWP